MAATFTKGHACFPALFARYRKREVGSGRTTRQPGQVRKEAALTSSGSGRSSASHPFPCLLSRQAAHPARRGSESRMSSADSQTRPAAAVGPEGADSASYRVLARKYRPATFEDLIGQEAM